VTAGDRPADQLVVDTSAVMAILLGEPSGPALLQAFVDATTRFVSAGTVLELGIVAESRRPGEGRSEVDRFVSRCDVVGVDETLVRVALDGWRRFGKGIHPAGLNYGDCFTYALAVRTGLPILCTGEDFIRTDAAVVDLTAVDAKGYR
jgi:ribonuclease VapC